MSPWQREPGNFGGDGGRGPGGTAGHWVPLAPGTIPTVTADTASAGRSLGSQRGNWEHSLLQR